MKLVEMIIRPIRAVIASSTTWQLRLYPGIHSVWRRSEKRWQSM
jgi:hypothetical protein